MRNAKAVSLRFDNHKYTSHLGESFAGVQSAPMNEAPYELDWQFESSYSGRGGLSSFVTRFDSVLSCPQAARISFPLGQRIGADTPPASMIDANW